MAHLTRAQLIRPSTPPRLAGPMLAEVVRDIASTGLIGHHVCQVVQLRYGRRVDADKRSTSDFRPTALPTVVHVEEYPWDSEQDCGHIDVLVRNLEVHPKSLYRASLGLGAVPTEIADYLTREADPANPPMTLSTLSLEVGAIHVGSPQVRPVHAGWIAFTIEGRGYPYPWSEQELIARIRAIEVIQWLEERLEQRWPVTESPGLLERLSRRRIADRIAPVHPAGRGWFWAISST